MAKEINIVELRKFLKYLHPDYTEDEINLKIAAYLKKSYV